MPVATSSMSSRLENTSAILGEFMLKGWTLTDLHCDTCNITPLMREPTSLAQREGRSPIQFCALCDGGPYGDAAAQSSNPGPVPIPLDDIEIPPSVLPSASIAQINTRDTSRSDAAADQISQLLLQGYSLLNENCPTPDCRGIPLVGYPRRKDGNKDGRKMCVSCGNRWVLEGSMDGMTMLSRPFTSAAQAGAVPEAQKSFGADESPRSRKRRELYEVGTMMREEQAKRAQEQPVQGKGKAREEIRPEVDEGHFYEQEMAADNKSRSSSLDTSLHNATTSLASTLDRLAASLNSHTTSTSKADEARYFVDLKLHTEAMRDVLSVLGMVEKLRK